MNPWESFNEYEKEQRQQRLEKQQSLAEELQAKHLEEMELLQERNQEIQVLQEHATEHVQALTKIEERLRVIQELAKVLKKSNQERQKVIEAITLKMQEKGYTTSPLEIAFYRAWLEAGHDFTLKPQHRIDKYRVDFAHVESMVVIEIDGHTFHSSRKDRNRDYQRQRAIEDAGWYFVRFTGSEVFADAENCAEIAYKKILARRGEVGSGEAR